MRQLADNAAKNVGPNNNRSDCQGSCMSLHCAKVLRAPQARSHSTALAAASVPALHVFLCLGVGFCRGELLGLLLFQHRLFRLTHLRSSMCQRLRGTHPQVSLSQSHSFSRVCRQYGWSRYRKIQKPCIGQYVTCCCRIACSL